MQNCSLVAHDKHTQTWSTRLQTGNSLFIYTCEQFLLQGKSFACCECKGATN